MKLAERLCGAMIAGLLAASLISQAEAVAAAPDPAQEIGQARQLLGREFIAVAYPEQQFLGYFARYATTVQYRSVIAKRG